MENYTNIYDLLPEELVEAIQKLTDALKIIENRKNTISKVVDNNIEKIECSCCSSKLIVKIS